MNSKQYRRAIKTALLALALAAGLFAYTGKTPPPETNVRGEAARTGVVLLTIEGVYANKSVPIYENETMLEALRKLDAGDPELRLQTKEYSGLGTLIESMHGWKNGADNKYWQYKVDGVMPQVGAGAYKLQNGNRIEWYFGPSLF